MKQTAIVVAPGRGTYNRSELGYFARHHPDKIALLQRFDTYRAGLGQAALSDLDGASRFSGAVHTTGDNAAALIHACAYADFQSIDQSRFDILGVTGNSMGWYIALTCAGALSEPDGMHVVNTMGTLMHRNAIGGQLVYPFIDDTWCEIAGMKDRIQHKTAEINARDGQILDLSINLGGMLVLAGNEAGLRSFEAEMPRIQDRFPLRLPHHAAFHTDLQSRVAQQGRAVLDADLFTQPTFPLIDGRGGLWHPQSCDPAALWAYTFGHQVTCAYDFTTAIQVAAREFMPDVFIVLGPGSTLGGAVAQSLQFAGWRGIHSKAAFSNRQSSDPALISMGRPEQRSLVLHT